MDVRLGQVFVCSSLHRCLDLSGWRSFFTPLLYACKLILFFDVFLVWELSWLGGFFCFVFIYMYLVLLVNSFLVLQHFWCIWTLVLYTSIELIIESYVINKSKLDCNFLETICSQWHLYLFYSTCPSRKTRIYSIRWWILWRPRHHHTSTRLQ